MVSADVAPAEASPIDVAAADAAPVDTSAVVGDCLTVDDYTPCMTVTVPDRSYDICIGGECVSPGCDTADCNPAGPGFALPDTGQRTCYDDTGAAPCPGDVALGSCSSIAFCGQDAQYGWDLAYPQGDRYTLHEAVAGEPVVVDAVTGLMWQRCSGGLRGSTCATGALASLTWTEAIDYCEALDWSGRSDWHLPDRYELTTTLSFDTAYPALDSSIFVGAIAGVFWSISTNPEELPQAYNVRGTTGVLTLDDKTTSGGVRCVRRNVAAYDLRADERFLRQGATEPVVTDAATGLTWQGCLAGQSGADCSSGSASSVTWQAALSYCEALSWGGLVDWRLPSVLEGLSVLSDRSAYIHMDPIAFPNPVTAPAWCSTTCFQLQDEAWYVNRSAGAVNRDLKSRTKSVMCVRDAG